MEYALLRPISTLKNFPKLPSALRQLSQIAYNNLCWSWDHGAIELFRRLDAEPWENSGHNPVHFVGNTEQSQLESATREEAFPALLSGVADQLDTYVRGEGIWFQREHAKDKDLLVAFFSAEFGITECLSISAENSQATPSSI
jgi:glycogen phosphorylase